MRYGILDSTYLQTRHHAGSDFTSKSVNVSLRMALLFAFHVLSLLQVFGMAQDGMGCTITDTASMAIMGAWMTATVVSFAMLCVAKRRAE